MRELQTILKSAITRLEANLVLKAHAIIISEDKGAIDTQLEKALSRLSKICIVVALTSARSDSPNAPGPVIDDLQLLVEISENVLLNRKGVEETDYITALSAIQEVLNSDTGLHLYHDATNHVDFVAQDPLFQIVEPPKGATTAYQSTFKTTAVISPTA